MTRRDLEYRMWMEACEFMERAERLHRQFFTPPAGAGETGWEPPVDLYETDRELWLIAALPGVDPETIEISAQDGILTVTGRRALPQMARTARIQRVEIPQGRFIRRLALPLDRLEIVEHGMENGCLVLRMSKKG